ncbi:MAG: GTP-binding protein [Candidatus Thorarchaeota archaeon]
MSSKTEGKEKYFKIAVLGDAAVGKTTLVRAFIDDTSKPLGAYRPTLGAEIKRREIDVILESKRRIASLAIWDLSGQPTFRSLVTKALAGAEAAIVIFDIGRIETFQSVASWIDFLWKAEPHSIQKPIVLVGNKKDLRRKRLDRVTPGQARDYAGQVSRYTGLETPYHETAAIEKGNVAAPFKDAARLLLQQ